MADTMEHEINGFAVYWCNGRIMVERREADLTGHEFDVSEDRKSVRLHLTAGVAPEDDDHVENAQRAAEEFLRRERSFCLRGAGVLQDRAARF